MSSFEYEKEKALEDRVIALQEAFASDHLNLILFPTEKCNFRCSYCYEDFEVGKMPAHVVEGVKKLIDRRTSDLRSLVISWFGGEPLLGMDIIRSISQHVVLHKRESLVFSGNISTNGYLLTADIFNELLEYGVNEFQISLDGYGAGHDKTRRRADHQGTFDTIWNNLLAIKLNPSQDFTLVIRVHLLPANIASVQELIDQINTEFGDDPRFKVHLKPVGDLGGPNSGAFTTLHDNGDDFLDTTTFDELLASLKQTYSLDSERPYVCYAAKSNSIAIRADGKLAKCTVALNDDRNSLGHITAEGELNVELDKWRKWLAGFTREETEWQELACPYNYM